MNISTRKAENQNSTNFAFIDEYYLNSKNNNSNKINQIFQKLDIILFLTHFSDQIVPLGYFGTFQNK